MGIVDDLRASFRKGTSLTRLIYLNIAVFILIATGSIISFLLDNPELQTKILNILSVPSSIPALLKRPWTLITYMFTHKDILHILFNLLWLYWFGTIFLEYLDQKKLVAVYLLGGLTGGLVYILSFNIFPVFDNLVATSVAIGASASVMAVVISIAAYVPDYSVNLFLFGRIRIKYLALGIFVLTSVLDFSVNSGGKLAHIGGALFGYLYTINLRRGRDLGKWINRVIGFFVTIFRPKKKMKVTYKRSVTDYDYNKIKAERQERINMILDKISKGGYDSLTREEKDFLFRESQKKK
ncbi:MAG: rhomboid family intramembrane serine protease [Bacteroidales bacterium]|nr:rhomboid family intramembrane serine protease [Bacteroidales bacterium]